MPAEPVTEWVDESPRLAVPTFILYDQITAGRLAIQTLTNIEEESGNALEFQPFPWSSALLADEEWRGQASVDAVGADILVIAAGVANQLPSAVLRWFESIIARKQGVPAAVIVLLSHSAVSNCSVPAWLETIRHATYQAGLDFFMPINECGVDSMVAGIRHRAESITPLLDEILHHQAFPRRNSNFLAS